VQHTRGDGGGRLRAPRSSHDLGSSFGLDRADVDVRARRVVDVVDGDVGEAVLSPCLEFGIAHLAVLVLVELLPDADGLVLREARAQQEEADVLPGELSIAGSVLEVYFFEAVGDELDGFGIGVVL
jgi:hypothetical protein